MNRRNVPKYCRHSSGQARVCINGKFYYLGKFGSAESNRKYERLIAQYLATGHVGGDNDLTVTELISRYWQHVKGYYRKAGEPTSEVERMKVALRYLRRLYGTVPVSDFTPLDLKAVRQSFIDSGICRSSVNKQVDRIRRMFRWGVSEGMVPPNVLHGLKAVEALRKGRCPGVPEPAPVTPIDETIVEATIPHMPPVVRDIVRFQLATGCRPGEACQLRAADIDRSGPVWLYRPESHKTQHLGRERIVPIGPKTQEILISYLAEREEEEYLFSPKSSEQLRRIDARRNRKTPLSCGNRAGTNRKKKPKRKAGDCYSTATYRRAIERACENAKVERWTPGRLRHTAATKIRSLYGLEAAQVMLGHSTADTTQIYAERDLAKAVEVAAQIG